MKVRKIDHIWRYVIFTYLLFWFMILGIGGTAIFVFKVSQPVMMWVTTLCSWAPTIVLLIMLKKLKPGLSISGFYKKAFAEKLNFGLLFGATLLIVGIFLISAWLLSVFEKTAITAQLTFIPAALLSNILFTAIQGASGEESGWRGYLLPELESRFGFFKGNLVLGFVWSFWHLPLWFVSASYSGVDLLLYIVGFIAGLTAFSMVMGAFMKKCSNLFLAFWMHFWFNFVLTFFIGKDVYLLLSLAALYVAAAAVAVISSNRSGSHSCACGSTN